MGSGVKTSRPGFLCNFGQRVKISSWPTPKQHEPHVCGCTSVYKSLNDLKPNPNPAYSLHCSLCLGLPFRILYIDLVKPKKGTTMETIGKPQTAEETLKGMLKGTHKGTPLK